MNSVAPDADSSEHTLADASDASSVVDPTDEASVLQGDEGGTLLNDDDEAADLEDGATLADPKLAAAFPHKTRHDDAEDNQTLVTSAPSDSDRFGDDPEDQPTMFDAQLNARPAPSDADGTLLDQAAPDDRAELVDQTMVSTPSDDADGATMADPSLAARPEADNDGATFVDPKLAGGARPTVSETDATMVSFGQEAEVPEPDATFVQSSLETEGTMLTNIASSAGATQMTALESQNDDPNATQIQSVTHDDGQTAIEGQQSHDPHATLITQAEIPGKKGSTSAKKPKKRGVHETADRWDHEERYNLVTNFARGGLGQIWMANDNRLRREVAYKEMLPKALSNRDALERFLEEAQITGQLEHPCIMPIYDIGYQPNGAPFYSMKLVRGETFEKTIGQYHELPADHPDRPVQFRRLLKNFLDICNALGFAHDRGVLHRDLKPLNVMIGPFGETIVLDWGLAKVMGEATNSHDQAPVTTSTASLGEGETLGQSQAASQMTNVSQTPSVSISGKSQTSTVSGTKRLVLTDVRTAGTETMMGSIMGTPAYMPPEQALGKLDELDGRTDIYSLGGILYKLLTNQQPIEKGKIPEVLKRVRENIIIPPRTHVPSLHPALEAITLKAMAKLREDRYATALLLAADVEAWMADEPVSCYADPWTVQVRRWAKRHRTAVTGVAVGVSVMIIVGIGLAVMRQVEINRLHGIAEVAMSNADRDSKLGDYATAKTALAEAIAKLADQPAVSQVERSLRAQLELIETQRVDELRRSVEKELASAESQQLDGKFELARTTLAKQITRLQQEASLTALAADVNRRMKSVESAISEAEQIALTEKRFATFRDEVDTVRARGSLQDPDDLEADLKLAKAAAERALKLFDLDAPQPLTRVPQHFEKTHAWTRAHFAKTTRWPADVLREEAFEVSLMMSELVSTNVPQADSDAVQAAARKSLEWLAHAESLGIKTQALHGRRAQFYEVLGQQQDFQKSFAAAQATTPKLALDFYLIAESLRKRGDYPNALTHYLKAQRVDPNHYWVQHFTGLCYLQLNQPSGAVSCFSSCVAMRPSYVWSFMLRGVAYSKLNDFESAHEDLEIAQQLSPDLFNVYVNRGAVHFAQSKFDAAVADFKKASEIAPDSNLPLINLAAAYLAKADDLAKNNPQNLSALDLLAEEAKLATAALNVLNRAAEHEKSPSSPSVYASRAKVYLRLENVAAASQDLVTHIKLERNPKLKASSYKRLANIHSLRRNFAEAIEALESARKLVSTDPETVYLLGESHLQLRDFEKAVAHFEQFQRMMNVSIVDQVPNADSLYSGMATAYNALGKKSQAVEFYTLSLLLDPNQAGTRSKRGWAYLIDNTQLAIREFEQAVQNNKEDPDTQIGLAYAYVQAGRLNDVQPVMAIAVKLAREQVKNDPNLGVRGWVLFHNSATVYSQLFDKVRNNTQLPADQKEAIVTTAISLLTEGLKVTGTDAAQQKAALFNLQRDTALDPIRQHPAFVEFIKRLGLTAPQ